LTPHEHGHRSVFHDGCEDCLVLDLAGTPDTRVRLTLQHWAIDHGKAAANALMRRITAARKRGGNGRSKAG
jgi:hypothetical protein